MNVGFDLDTEQLSLIKQMYYQTSFSCYFLTPSERAYLKKLINSPYKGYGVQGRRTLNRIRDKWINVYYKS